MYYLLSRRFLKKYVNNLQYLRIKISQNISVVLEKATAMLEKWEGGVDNKKVFGALLTDPSKAFNSHSHELIISKLSASGFSFSALRLIIVYQTGNKELKLLMFKAHGRRLYSEYLKGQCLDLHHSTSF